MCVYFRPESCLFGLLRARSSNKSVLPDLVVVGLLLGTHRHSFGLKRSESSAESARLLHSQVLGRVLLLLKISSGSVDSLLAEDGEDLGNGLSHLSDLGQLSLRLGRHLRNSKGSKFFLNTSKGQEMVRFEKSRLLKFTKTSWWMEGISKMMWMILNTYTVLGELIK